MMQLSTKKGQALVVLAGAMAFVITVAGVAGDVANIFTTKNKAQRAADAAAMAGLVYYLDHLDDDDVLSKANQVSRLVADLNMQKLGLPLKSKGQSININNAMYDNGITNTLTINTEAKTVFLQILGARAKNVSVTAVSQSVPAVVSLILDTSNSMDDTEFQLLKNGAIEFINQFQPKLDRIAIITFNAYAKVERPMSTFANHQELIDIIGTDLATGIQRGSGTNLAHAIERGRKEIEKIAGTTLAPKNTIPQKAIKAMVIFSDGAPNVMKGRFLTRLKNSGSGWESANHRQLHTTGWQGELEPRPSAVVPPIDPYDINDDDPTNPYRFSVPYDYWFYSYYFNGHDWLNDPSAAWGYYYRPVEPLVVTMFRTENDISQGMITNPARDFVRCEEAPRPYSYRQYTESGWTCLQNFSYRDSRGQLRGDWIDGSYSWWCDGCHSIFVEPVFEADGVTVKEYGYYYWQSYLDNHRRIWSSRGIIQEEIYNSAIYEADYAKSDKITIYVIALGQTREDDTTDNSPNPATFWCPGTNSWLPLTASCPNRVYCKDRIFRPGTSYKDACPRWYCRNTDGTFREKMGEADHCTPEICGDGSPRRNRNCPNNNPPLDCTANPQHAACPKVCTDGTVATWCYPCPGTSITTASPANCPPSTTK